MRSPIAALTFVPGPFAHPDLGTDAGARSHHRDAHTQDPAANRRGPVASPCAGRAQGLFGRGRARSGPLDQLKTPPKMVLPDDPLEPYLLTKENGPFMIMAKVFRGPDAEKMALALCLELRNDFGLPAYILRTKDFPMRSYIRGTPPTAPSVTMRAAIKQPEAVRTHDEAAVLVGNEKTLAATEILLNKVKKLDPKCLKEMPHLWQWRHGLSRRSGRPILTSLRNISTRRPRTSWSSR